MAATQPVSPQVVGNAFVQQYYHILHNSPHLVYRFYQDISQIGRPEKDGSMGITTTMKAIGDKIISLNYDEIKAEIRSVDAQGSSNGGVHVLVTGYLTGKDRMIRDFVQTFFLAPQDKGYYVLNDAFRYVDTVTRHAAANTIPAIDLVGPVAPEQTPPPPSVVENHISEHSTPPTEEANGGEVFNPPENEDVAVVEEEVPVPEVVDEVQDDSKLVVESNTKIEEIPKKSYASIVMHLKESAATFSPPAHAVRKSVPKIQHQVNQSSTPVTDGPVLNSDAADNGNNQEEEAEGYSIYIKGLPMNATVTMLYEEFKKYGPIKNGGIQVRSNRQQGVCFGFVEFEVATAVQKALEASPVAISGCSAVVEEKKSTNSRVNNRGRFLPGRGSGFRNEGMRSGRGYNNRNEFGNRDRGGHGHRGGSSSSNRVDGYQRADNNGSDGGHRLAPNGNAKTLPPGISISATA